MQWIDEADAVFRGGGVKGLALAGALCGFAEHPTKPIRTWKNVAGASAGAIIACYLATGHDAQAMLDLMRRTSFGQFADFPLHSKLLGIGRLLLGRGMAPGKAFESWFEDVLGGATFADVRKNDDPADHTEQWWLKLIAVDVTAGRLLVLPGDLQLYRDPRTGRPIEPNDFSIARAARMSMSIPYFFDPVQLQDVQGRTCLIVDGGTLSNFPVWLWDVDPKVTGRQPIRPTFGFTLKGGHGFGGPGVLAKVAPWQLRFAFEIFHTAESAWDERFVSHSTRVRTLAVDADDVGTTEFDLSQAKQQLLVANGRAAAKAFLDDFSLEQYENTYHAELAQSPAAVA
ncbi:MAG TPA: patatin-like phospholipase family protein [Gaiellaceae bacterium]|nr:patatin-like phospholipase family protein [Gaiellaceae bacterium]